VKYFKPIYCNDDAWQNDTPEALENVRKLKMCLANKE
jgi:hypothetical protein